VPSNVRINITLRNKAQKRRVQRWSERSGTKPSQIVQHLFEIVAPASPIDKTANETLRSLGFPL
jgi:hypothetical protein